MNNTFCGNFNFILNFAMNNTCNLTFRLPRTLELFTLLVFVNMWLNVVEINFRYTNMWLKLILDVVEINF